MGLGVPGFLALAFEWWSFEISTLVAGSISTTQLTISSTILQLATIYFMALMAFSRCVGLTVQSVGIIVSSTSRCFASFVGECLRVVLL